MDCKLQLVKTIEESLVSRLDESTLRMVSDEITKALCEYEVSKAETSLVSYEGINEAVLKRFCACLIISGKSEKTIAQYKRTATKLYAVVQKNYTDMTVYDIRLFLAVEKQRGISNRTLENVRANLSAFFQWMTNEEMIQKNPCALVQPIKYTDKIRKPFPPVELDALRFACKTERERAMIELLLSSGIRVSELTALKVSDINFDTKSLYVRCGKGGKSRTTYISDLAKTHLLTYLLSRKDVGDYLFYSKKKEPLNNGGVRFILNTIAERANVENVHPHRFRRTFATTLAGRGMDIQEIRKLLGHSRIDTTLEYVYTSDEQVHKSYERFIA